MRRKSKAPSFMASMTALVGGKAVARTTMTWGSCWRRRLRTSMPLTGLRWNSEMTRSGLRELKILSPSSAVAAVATPTRSVARWRWAHSRKSVSGSMMRTCCIRGVGGRVTMPDKCLGFNQYLRLRGKCWGETDDGSTWHQV